LLNVCFAPDSGRAADIPEGPVCAKSGHFSVFRQSPSLAA
jgi:hypothetical protein